MFKRPITSALALLVTASFAACTFGDDDDSGDGNGDVTDEELGELAIEYAECFRDHGVDMPDPEIDPDGAIADGYNFDPYESGASEETIAAAEEACQPIADKAGPAADEVDQEQLQQELDQMLEVAKCMREKGYDVGDPRITEDGGIASSAGLPQSATDQQKQAHLEATKSCQQQLAIPTTPTP